MKGRKTLARLQRRQKSWEAAKLQAEKMHEDRGGSYVSRPGSNKKPFPAKTNKRNGR